MALSKKKKFVQLVLKEITFIFDYAAIEEELLQHIEDRKADFLKEGLKEEEAEEKAVERMGNPTELGKELNKEHKPLLGSIWLFTNVVTVIVVLLFIYIVAGSILPAIFYDHPAEYIKKENIKFHAEMKEEVRIDDTVIRITDIILEKNNTLYIVYTTHGKKWFAQQWTSSYIGKITDDNGNTYNKGSSSTGGIIRHHVVRILDFSTEAEVLHIDYNRYNREYHFSFPIGEALREASK